MKLKIMATTGIHGYFRMFPDVRFEKVKKGLGVFIFIDLKSSAIEKIFPDFSGKDGIDTKHRVCNLSGAAVWMKR